MNKFFKCLTLILLLSATSRYLVAQDFTVKIESTDKYSHYFAPVKAGGSFQFQINVKNNRKDTCTVSLQKDDFGLVKDWVTIDNNSQQIFPAQSINFLLTLKVPASTTEGNYALFLNFNGYDRKGNNHSFNYIAQSIIVDNSNPIVPTFTTSQRSYSVGVYSWDSWDFQSSFYTAVNLTSGISGIKSYTIALKDPSTNAILQSKSYEAKDSKSHIFKTLQAITNYKVTVTATDLAGNINSADKTVITAPAPPVISASATEYCTTKLTFISQGATSYNIYNATSTPVLLANVSSTSYTVSGLTAGTTYKFYAEAKGGSETISDASKTITVTTKTVPVPTISAPSLSCSSTARFTIPSIPSGCTVIWQNSPNLTPNNISGSTTDFTCSGNGEAWVSAYFSTCGGIGSSVKKTIWYGPASNLSIEGSSAVKKGGINEYRIKDATLKGITNYSWEAEGGLFAYGSTTSSTFKANAKGCGLSQITCNASNSCPGSSDAFLDVEVICISPAYTVFPNPVSSELTISQVQTVSSTLSEDAQKTKPIKSIKVIDSYGSTYLNKNFKNETFDTKIDVSSLKEGSYFLIINESTSIESIPFIKK